MSSLVRWLVDPLFGNHLPFLTFFVAIVVFLVFGGIYVGILPHNGPVSWEGHLSGVVAGLLAAFNNHGKQPGKK